MRPSRSYVDRITRSRPGSARPRVLAEGLRVLGRELGHLGLDGGGDGAEGDPRLPRERGEPRALEERGRLPDLRPRRGWPRGAAASRRGGRSRAGGAFSSSVSSISRSGRLRLQGLLEAQEERALGHVLRLVRLLDVGLEPLEAPLHGAEVGEDELELEHLRVAPGVDRAVGVGGRLRLEGAHHVHERVHPAQGGQVHERRPLALRDAGDVHVLDGGERLLLRLEDLGQAVDARVGDAGDAQRALPGARPAAAAGVPVRSWKSVLLPGEGEPEDAGLHAAIIRAGRGRTPGAGVESPVGMLPALLALALQAGPALPGEGVPSPPPPGEGPVILFLVDNSASLPPLDPEEKRVAALEKMFGFLQGHRYRLILFGGKDEISVDDVSRYRNDGPVDGLLLRVSPGEAAGRDLPPRHRPAHGPAHGRESRPRPEGLARRAEGLGRALALDPRDGEARPRDGPPPLRRARGRAPGERWRGGTASSPPASSSTWSRPRTGRRRRPSPRRWPPSSTTTASCCGSSSTAWPPTRA